ncbi:MAG: hypothetical protein DRN53_05310 [Thermoprotei archaeon]|nr:MAG: hypothetical protein DRN53_05310 [Thermoprotei archaeon]
MHSIIIKASNNRCNILINKNTVKLDNKLFLEPQLLSINIALVVEVTFKRWSFWTVIYLDYLRKKYQVAYDLVKKS